MTDVPPLARLKQLMAGRTTHDAAGFTAHHAHPFTAFNLFAIPSAVGPETHADIGDQT